MKKEFWIILICTILLIVFLSYAMYYMNYYKKELTANPMVYGAEKISEKNDGKMVSCSCFVGFKQFSFTNEGYIQELKGGVIEEWT